MEYLLLFAAIPLFTLSYRSNLRYKKLKYTGKIPAIQAAKRNTTLFSVMGVVSIIIFIFIVI
jgi:hypothetical protein